MTKAVEGSDGDGPGESAAEASVEEYESLRTHVLTGSTVDRPPGLVVLLRHGVAAWRIRRSTPPPAPSPAPRTAMPVVASDRHAALVPVLVNMVLGTHPEVGV